MFLPLEYCGGEMDNYDRRLVVNMKQFSCASAKMMLSNTILLIFCKIESTVIISCRGASAH